MSKIGIIGQGFVGNALKEGFVKEYPDLLTYDLKKELCSCNSLEELVDKCEFIKRRVYLDIRDLTL